MFGQELYRVVTGIHRSDLPSGTPESKPTFLKGARRLMRSFPSSIRLLGSLTLVLFAATAGTAQTRHPIEKLIPHVDHDHVVVDTSGPSEMWDRLPRELKALGKYLRGSGADQFRQTNVFVDRVDEFSAAAVEGRRLLLLDVNQHRLIEYDLESNEKREIAVEGNGPGDLHFPTEVRVEGENAYVPMHDRRIDRFDCRKIPCELVHERTLAFSALSVAPVDSQLLAVLGQVPLRDTGESISGDQSVVRLVDQDGKAHRSFGSAYASSKWLMQDAYLKGGEIRYSNRLDQYALTYEKLPYVYVYDNEGKLERSFRIDPFTIREWIYTKEGRRRNVVGPWTYVANTSMWGDRYLLVQTWSHHPSLSYLERSVHRYYVVDLKTTESLILGTDRVRVDGEDGPAPDRAIYVTEIGLVMNEGGAIRFAPFE